MFAGAGSGPLRRPGVGGANADLWASAPSLESVLPRWTTGPWTVRRRCRWLLPRSVHDRVVETQASQAQLAAIQARAAATAFVASVGATVHPTADGESRRWRR